MVPMRRIVMFNRVTADGYFSAADGRLDWAVPEEELEKGAAGNLPGADTILFGRKTYQLFESFWPTRPRRFSYSTGPTRSRTTVPELRAMATWINEATKLVFSKTLKEVTWKNSRLIHEFDPREMEAVKTQPGKDMMVFGSGSIVSQLAQHGLIDEYQFVVTPILLGSGRSMLCDMPKSVKLDLMEAKKYHVGQRDASLRAPQLGALKASSHALLAAKSSRAFCLAKGSECVGF